MNRPRRIWYLLAFAIPLMPPAARWIHGQTAPSPADDSEAVQAGEVLFKRVWQVNDPLCGDGDGLGPVFNEKSCAACHITPTAGGSGYRNITLFTVRTECQPLREGGVHAFHVHGVEHQETLRHLHGDLPAISRPTLDQLLGVPPDLTHEHLRLEFPSGIHISQRNTPALFGAGLIDAIPESAIVANQQNQRRKWDMAERLTAPVGRVVYLSDGRVGRFGWKAQVASLADFVRVACANELGLGNPGHRQPAPLYEQPTHPPARLDLTDRQCDDITAFCASLPRPVQRQPKGAAGVMATMGRVLFETIGCADCHTPALGGVDGIFSDLLLHDMGDRLVGGGSYGDARIAVPNSPSEGLATSEWRTPPLWGVADSAPYLHDGRANDLLTAIQLHDGQARWAAQSFAALSTARQAEVIAFLKTLRAP